MLNFNQGSPFQFGNNNNGDPLQIQNLPPQEIIQSPKDGSSSSVDTIGSWQNTGSQTVGFQEGPISIAEFSRIVQSILDKAKEQSNSEDIKDSLFNKGVSFRISYELQLLKMLGDGIALIGQSLKNLTNEANFQIDGISALGQSVYAGQEAEKRAAENYNQAVKNYNDPNSPDYQNMAVLSQAKADYDNFQTARQAEIDAYNDKVRSYNAQVDINNAQIDVINKERRDLGLPALPHQEKASLYRGTPLPISVLGEPVKVPPSTGAPRDPVKLQSVSTYDMMRQYYWPVHDSVIGFIREYTRTLDITLSDNSVSNLMLQRLLQALPTLLLMGLATSFATSEINGKSVSPMGSPYIESIMRRMLSSALINALSNKLGQNLPDSLIAAIQLSSMALIARSALFASTVPALAFLGDRMARLGLDSQAINLALTAAFLGRIKYSTSKSAVRRSVLNAINSDPGLKGLSFSEKKELAHALTKMMQTSILNSAFLSAGLALGLPGLSNQLAGLALQYAGVGGFPPATNFGSLLNNRLSTAIGQALIAGGLVNSRGMQESEALSITGKALSNTLALGPFPSAREFTTTLAHELRLEGVSRNLAKSLSLDFTAALLGGSPKALLSNSVLDTALTLSLLSPASFLTNAAVAQALTGLDPSIALSYSKAIEALFGPNGPSKSPTLREVQRFMHSQLVNLGVSSADAWKLSRNFVNMIKGGEAFSLALNLNPSTLSVIQGSLAANLLIAGFSQKTSDNLAAAIVAAALVNPSILLSANFSNHVAQAISLSAALKVGLFENLAAQALASKGMDISDSIAIAQTIASALFAKPSTFSSTDLMRGALLNALTSSSSLSSNDALDVAANLSQNAASLFDKADTALINALVSLGLGDEASKAIGKAVNEDASTGHFGLGTSQEFFSNSISNILAANLGLDNEFAKTIAGSLILDEIVNRGPLSSLIAEKLIESGLVKNNAESQIFAAVLFDIALRIPDALSSDTALRQALATAIALSLNTDLETARDVISNLTLNDLIPKDKLIDQLKGLFLAQGLDDKLASTYAALASAVIFQSSGNTGDSGFQTALQGYLFASGLPFAASLSIAAGFQKGDFLNLDNLENALTTAFLSSGKYGEGDANAIAKQAILLVLSNSLAFQGDTSFKAVLADSLFVYLGIDQETAKDIASSLSLDNVVNREDIKTKLNDALLASGFDSNAANLISLKIAETFFTNGNLDIDSGISNDFIQTLVLASSFGKKEVSNYLLAALTGNLVADPEVQKQLSVQVTNSVFQNPDSYVSDDAFRAVLQDALLTQVSPIDRETAERVANGIQITDAIRMEILKQAILNAIETGEQNG